MKKYIVSMLAVLCIFGTTGCGDDPNIEVENSRFEMVEFVDKHNSEEIYIVRDTETGVNYIVADGRNSFAMSPLYDHEGNVVIN